MTDPLTVSASRVAPEDSAPAKERAPDTVSRCARSKAPPLTSRRPLTVEASRSPLAPRTVTLPFTDSALMCVLAPETCTAPLTLSAEISRACPPTVMLPFTVSAETVPLTPSTVMDPLKLSIWRRLFAGTWTSRRGGDAVRVALGVDARRGCGFRSP